MLVSTESIATWRATFVYGEPRREHRIEFWDFLRFMHAQWNGLSIYCADFNEPICHDKHMCFRDRSDSQMTMFRDCLDDCGLIDLGFLGPKFTWTNKQDADSNVKVRLDRAVTNGEFSRLFEDYHVENIITTTSDHYAISISLSSQSGAVEHPLVLQGFCFEAMWLRSLDYKEVMEQAWVEGSNSTRSLQSTWTNLHQLAGSLG